MNFQLSNQTILHLSLINGIGPATIKLVIENIAREKLPQIYTYSASDFQACGIYFERAVKIVTGLKDQSLLDKELALIQKYNISWCVLGSSEYSSLLASIEQPPAILYYQGANLFYEMNAIAFVGARKADAYARVAVDKLIPPLVDFGWVIVSGGALGTDSFVHDKVVRSGGKTIAVLGSGLLHWYPASNYQLFHQIVQSGGMIVSCFPLQTQPIPSNFPARNRIIAGLSQGTVVVQAATKSGALITADFAVEQGREVFAVPGSIEYGLHDGCHNLIQQGAKLVTCAHDIIVELGFDIGSQQQVDSQLLLPLSGSCSYEKSILEITLVATSTETLLSKIDLSLDDLMLKLFNLSLEGKITQDMMGLWKRI
jgi:DNA processing protein